MRSIIYTYTALVVVLTGLIAIQCGCEKPWSQFAISMLHSTTLITECIIGDECSLEIVFFTPKLFSDFAALLSCVASTWEHSSVHDALFDVMQLMHPKIVEIAYPGIVQP